MKKNLIHEKKNTMYCFCCVVYDRVHYRHVLGSFELTEKRKILFFFTQKNVVVYKWKIHACTRRILKSLKRRHENYVYEVPQQNKSEKFLCIKTINYILDGVWVDVTHSHILTLKERWWKCMRARQDQINYLLSKTPAWWFVSRKKNPSLSYP